MELTNANDETIVIDDDDDNDDHPTIQKIRETLSDSNNVNKQLSTASSETDPLAFASAETETIIGDIDENDQVGREIMSAFGNNDPDPLNTCNGVEEDKQTAENSETNSLHTEMLIPIDEVSMESEVHDPSQITSNNDEDDDELTILDSFPVNNDLDKENQNPEEMPFRQSSIALHPIFPELLNQQTAEDDNDPPSKRQRLSLFSKSTEPITPRIIVRNNGNFPLLSKAKQTASTVNKQLTMPLRRQGNGTLNPRQISLLVNQRNVPNFLSNTPVPITQLTNSPNANKQLTISSPTSAKTRYHCDVCPNSFSDMNNLQLHVKKMHEIRSETRTLVASTVKAEQDVICHNCLRTPAGIRTHSGPRKFKKSPGKKTRELK